MGELIDLVDKVKKYGMFNPTELVNVLVTVIVLAFVISFRDWGPGAAVDLKIGSINFLGAFFIVALSVLAHLSSQKITALRSGHIAEYRMWTFGLVFALVFAFLSRGYIWILVSGGIMLHHLAGHRIGFWRYGISDLVIGLSALAGPSANILLAIILRIIENYWPSALLAKAIGFNVWYAVWSMLLIPPLDGNRVLFSSRLNYFFTFFFILGAAIFLYLKINIWISVLASLIIGALAWFVYYIFYEHGAWQGPAPKNKWYTRN